VIVADGASLQVVDGEGRFVRQLDAPGVACRPIRWWDAATFLARCIPDEVLDYLAYPVYGRLWLVPADGSPATALTALPADPVFVGDFGFADAWRWGDGVYANWEGDCGAAAIHLVRPDGTTELFDVDPESFSAHQIVGTVGSDLLIRRMGTCGGAYGSLHLLGPGGADWRDLIVPPTNETWGAIDALVLPVEP
jgi:hypothetical protein